MSVSDGARATRRDSSRFGLGAALAVSVLLHLVLTLLAFWVPIGAEPAAPAEPEDTEIRFTIAQSDATDGEEIPQGDLPPGSVPEFDSPAEPTPDGEPTELPSLQVPSSAAPPFPDSRPVEELLENVLRESADRRPPPAEPEPVEETGEPMPEDPEPDPSEAEPADLPELDRGVEQQRARRGRPGPDPRQPTLDHRLDEYGRALARARAAAPRPTGGGAPSNVFVPDALALPGTGFGVGNLEFESRDYDWSDYARQIYMAIWRAWHNRLYQTTDEFEKWAYQNGDWALNHASRVRFVIESSGQVTGISIEGTSGCGPLDVSAADALAEVILPPLPTDFPRSQEVVHARFIAIGEVRALRPTLMRLKRLGYF